MAELIYVIAELDETGRLVIEASPLLTELAIKGGGKVSVEITAYDSKVSRRFVNWYKGIVLPHIVESNIRLNGEYLTVDQVDLINKQHAAQLQFRTVIVKGRPLIVFDEFSTSSLSKKKATWFIQQIREYWAGRGIDIPDPEYPDMRRIDYSNYEMVNGERNEIRGEVSGQP